MRETKKRGRASAVVKEHDRLKGAARRKMKSRASLREISVAQIMRRRGLGGV